MKTKTPSGRPLDDCAAQQFLFSHDVSVLQGAGWRPQAHQAELRACVLRLGGHHGLLQLENSVVGVKFYHQPPATCQPHLNNSRVAEWSFVTCCYLNRAGGFGWVHHQSLNGL